MEEQFLRATRIGQLQTVKKILDQHPNLINKQDKRLGWTPLYRAVISGHEGTAIFLLKKGADPNILTFMQEAPIHQAVQNQMSNVIQALLQAEAQPNIQQYEGDTPLHFASTRGFLGIVQLLLKYQADPNIPNTIQQRTPMHQAVQNGNLDVIRLLFNHEASLQACDIYGKTPMDLATPEIIRLLDDIGSCTSSFTVFQTGDRNSHFSVQNDLKHIYDMNKRIRETVRASILNHSRNASVNEPDAQRNDSDKFKQKNRTFSFGRQRKSALYQWLYTVQLEEIYELLNQSGYDDLQQITSQMSSSLPLTEERLRKIGMVKSGHRRRFLAALEQESASLRTNRRILIPKKRGLFSCCEEVVPFHMEFLHLPTLEAWLEQLNLEEYYDNFLEAGYPELDSLLALMNTSFALDDEILTEIGVEKPGYRHRILAKLKEDCVGVVGMKRSGFSSKRRAEEHEKKNCILM